MSVDLNGNLWRQSKFQNKLKKLIPKQSDINYLAENASFVAPSKCCKPSPLHSWTAEHKQWWEGSGYSFPHWESSKGWAFQGTVPQSALKMNEILGSYVVNRMFTTRLIQWLGWVFKNKEKKKQERDWNELKTQVSCAPILARSLNFPFQHCRMALWHPALWPIPCPFC